MDEDDFIAVRKKPLKLAGPKKKKKHKNERPPSSSSEDTLVGVSTESRVIVTTTTKAEQAFKAKQDAIAQARILKKASKTHKQRVEEFNKHLDSLSEHYDIPKGLSLTRFNAGSEIEPEFFFNCHRMDLRRDPKRDQHDQNVASLSHALRNISLGF